MDASFKPAPGPAYVARTGVVSYDSAQWTGGVPPLDCVRNAHGMATLLQCGGTGRGETMEVDVPEADGAVTLFRIRAPCDVDLRIEGKPVRATYRTGEGCLLGPDTDSWWAGTDEGNNGWFHIHFDRALLRLVEDTHQMRMETVAVVSDRNITFLVSAIFELASRGDEPDPLLWQSLGQVLLWRLLLLTAGKRRQEANGGLAAWQARRTTEYLADNIGRKVTLDELAAIARLSPFHFARAFAKTVGMPPYRYQQKLRLDRARELLGQTDMRVIDVALAVGYESQQALSRVFSQQFGVTPSQWRRLHSA